MTNIVWFHLQEVPKIDKSINTESRDYRGLDMGERRNSFSISTVFVEDVEKILDLDSDSITFCIYLMPLKCTLIKG